MFNCRLYKNSGFNAVNIPDSPALLEELNYIDVQPLDILQDEWLDSVQVRATYDQVKDVDYAKIGNWYYAVNGVSMTSIDVAILSLVTDFLNTVGGVDNLRFLDGVTSRCHVSDDTFGKYTEEDPYLMPGESLKLEMDEVNLEDGEGTYKVAESTLDLGLMGMVTQSKEYYGGEDENVTVPKAYPKGGDDTTYEMQSVGSGAGLGASLYELDQTVGLISKLDLIRVGVENCRALGIENCITNVVEMPKSLINLVNQSEEVAFSSGTYPCDLNYKFWKNDSQQGASILTTMKLSTLNSSDEALKVVPYGIGKWNTVAIAQGKLKTLSSYGTAAMNFSYANVKNKRALYGSFNKYGILTNAGNRIESNPEDIVNPSNPGSGKPGVKVIADPHPTGSPYFAFQYDHGREGSFNWQNSIKGLQWKQLPLVFTKASGSALTTQQFENSRQLQQMQFEHSREGFINKAALWLAGPNSYSADTVEGVGTAVQYGAGGLALAAKLGIAGATTLNPLALGAAAAVGAGTVALSSRARKLNQAQQEYELQRRNELMQYITSQVVTCPTIHIPYDCNAYRDFAGETVFLYRYRYTDSDIQRIDRILTMYGYKVTMKVTDNLFKNRQYFNYVQANVTVTGKYTSFPKWVNEGVAAQLSGGVRVWHVLPNVSYYAENPIVS